MVKGHSDSERGNPLQQYGLLFPINSKDSYMYHPTDRIALTTAFVEHWLERESRDTVSNMYRVNPFPWCLDLWLPVWCLPVLLLNFENQYQVVVF